MISTTLIPAMPGFTHSEWLDDTLLRDWLLQYQEIVWDSARSTYILANTSGAPGTPISAIENWGTSPSSYENIAEEDRGAEVEPDISEI